MKIKKKNEISWFQIKRELAGFSGKQKSKFLKYIKLMFHYKLVH